MLQWHKNFIKSDKNTQNDIPENNKDSDADLLENE